MARAVSDYATDLTASLDDILARVAATRDEVGDAFPLHADPPLFRWRTTRRGSWAGGFWVGLLWRLASATGRREDHAAALAGLERLRYWINQDTSARAMILWYGAGRRTYTKEDDPVREVILDQGAEAFARSFDSKHQLFPEGFALAGTVHRKGGARASVDALAATTALLCWADRGGSTGYRELARVNLDSHLRLCLSSRGGVLSPVALDDPHESRPSSNWARGHAWALLAAATAVCHFGEPYRPLARDLAARWIEATGPNGGIPAYELDLRGPLDTSAAAIAALALLELDLGDAVREHGLLTLRTLLDEHLSPGSGEAPRGALTRGCYDLVGNVGTNSELIWGTYFLAESIVAVLTHQGSARAVPPPCAR